MQFIITIRGTPETLWRHTDWGTLLYLMAALLSISVLYHVPVKVINNLKPSGNYIYYLI
jgi:hypothetical protein